MARPVEGDRPGSLAMRAFDSVPRHHRFRSVASFQGEILDQLPTITQEYLQGALSYFAGHTDSYLRELGELGKVFFNPEVPYPGCDLDFSAAPTIIQGMKSLGFPQSEEEIFKGRRAVVMGFSTPRRVGFVLSYDFFTAANNPDKRIDVLGELAFNLSQIQSTINGSLFAPSDSARIRAEATEAHFYSQVKREQGVMLGKQARERLAKYPYGIFSTSIPPEARPPGYGRVN